MAIGADESFTFQTMTCPSSIHRKLRAWKAKGSKISRAMGYHSRYDPPSICVPISLFYVRSARYLLNHNSPCSGGWPMHILVRLAIPWGFIVVLLPVRLLIFLILIGTRFDKNSCLYDRRENKGDAYRRSKKKRDKEQKHRLLVYQHGVANSVTESHSNS